MIRTQLASNITAVISQLLMIRQDKPGRVAAFEFMVATPSIRDLIRDNKTFRITHPFHPYKDTEFEIDQVRKVGVERRVFFFNQKGRKSSVPLAWTDIGPQDLFVVLSAGRALFRVEDLLGLVRLIGEINSAKRK